MGTRGVLLFYVLLLAKLLPPILLYAALATGFYQRSPAFWLSASGLALIVYSALSFLKKDRLYILCSVLMSGLALSGVIYITGMRWLHAAYIPYVIIVSVFLPPYALIATILSVPLLEIRHLLIKGALWEELSIAGFAAASGAVSYVFLGRMRREKDRLSSSLRNLKDAAMESLSAESYVSRGVSLGLEADREIGDILLAIKHTLKPEAVSLFVPVAGELTLRCSTEKGGVRAAESGLIHLSFQRKEAIAIGNTELKRYNPGYERGQDVVSMAAVPVMDEGFAIGVLAADSGEPDRFRDFEVEGLRIFARTIAGIIKRQRVYAEMERAHLGLKVLHEESSRLVNSLRLDSITGELIEGVRRIVPVRETGNGVALFLRNGDGFELAAEAGIELPKKRKQGLRGTLLEMALKGREHIYIPDLDGYALPALPFSAGKVSSAFLLPLWYEKETIGALAVISPETHALTPYQIELLDVFGNQASTSLKNAMLHASIEKLATTDGLTGLYNHRQFQERLSEELKRLGRYSQPLSLLLIDIDFFKKINDAYGHPAGDAVLRAVAGIIGGAVREVDLPARYGGEEFAAILVGTDKKGALQTAERLRKAVMENDFRAEGKKIKVTVSVGVASVSIDAKIKEELIERADKALYQAKAGGRNRVVGWSEEFLNLSAKK